MFILNQEIKSSIYFLHFIFQVPIKLLIDNANGLGVSAIKTFELFSTLFAFSFCLFKECPTSTLVENFHLYNTYKFFFLSGQKTIRYPTERRVTVQG